MPQKQQDKIIAELLRKNNGNNYFCLLHKHLYPLSNQFEFHLMSVHNHTGYDIFFQHKEKSHQGPKIKVLQMGHTIKILCLHLFEKVQILPQQELQAIPLQEMN